MIRDPLPAELARRLILLKALEQAVAAGQLSETAAQEIIDAYLTIGHMWQEELEPS